MEAHPFPHRGQRLLIVAVGLTHVTLGPNHARRGQQRVIVAVDLTHVAPGPNHPRRVATTDCSRGFQPTVRPSRSSRRVATPDPTTREVQ